MTKGASGHNIRGTVTLVDEAKVRMVENIEALRAKLKFQTLVDGKLAPNGKVHLPGPKTTEKIPRCGCS